MKLIKEFIVMVPLKHSCDLFHCWVSEIFCVAVSPKANRRRDENICFQMLSENKEIYHVRIRLLNWFPWIDSITDSTSNSKNQLKISLWSNQQKIEFKRWMSSMLGVALQLPLGTKRIMVSGGFNWMIWEFCLIRKLLVCSWKQAEHLTRFKKNPFWPYFIHRTLQHGHTVYIRKWNCWRSFPTDNQRTEVTCWLTRKSICELLSNFWRWHALCRRFAFKTCHFAACGCGCDAIIKIQLIFQFLLVRRHVLFLFRRVFLLINRNLIEPLFSVESSAAGLSFVKSKCGLCAKNMKTVRLKIRNAKKLNSGSFFFTKPIAQ